MGHGSVVQWVNRDQDGDGSGSLKDHAGHGSVVKWVMGQRSRIKMAMGQGH